MEVYGSDQIVEVYGSVQIEANVQISYLTKTHHDASIHVHMGWYALGMLYNAITIALERTGNRMYMLCVCCIMHTSCMPNFRTSAHMKTHLNPRDIRRCWFFIPSYPQYHWNGRKICRGMGLCSPSEIFSRFSCRCSKENHGALGHHKIWLVVWNMIFFSIQLGSSSSQLTNSYFSEG